MKKPLIGLSTSFDTFKEGIFRHSNRIFLVYNYVDALIKAGAVPIPIPTCKDKKDLSFIDDLMGMLDGVIITGGNDIDPALYKMEPHPKLGELCIEKDNLEIKMIESALEHKKGIFGICKGMQLLNVYFGGTLYQDLVENPKVKIKHKAVNTLDVPVHSIYSEPDSLIESIIGKTHRVNSAHHQTINKLSEDFIISAYAPDGIVEAIEHKSIKNIFGVQFHPEMMIEQDKIMLDFFRRFVELCL